jgi:hypothetical protein
MNNARFYKELYRFRLRHEFYSDGLTTDFRLVPFGRTKNWLSVHEIVLKNLPDGFDLVYRTTDDVSTNPFVELDGTYPLVFGVFVKNDEILNLTNLPAKSDNSDLYICSTTCSTESLSWSTIATRSTQFTEKYSYNTNQISFKMEDKDGNVVYEETQFGAQDPDDVNLFHFSFSVSLRSDFNAGRYDLKTYRSGLLEDHLEVFLINQFFDPNLMGIIELEMSDEIDFTGALPHVGTLNFTALASEWVYYIQLGRDFLGGTFSIIDTTDPEADPPPFSEISELDDYKKGETVIFKSGASFKRTEAPRTTYKLLIEDSTPEFSLDKLPNPGRNNLNAIIHLKI